MALTILEGSTFCICDERGDIDGETQGLFADDTRFLSRLAPDDQRRAAAAALVRARSSTSRRPSSCATRSPAACRRTRSRSAAQRFVGDGHAGPLIVVQNQGDGAASRSSSRSSSATDFADILSVKEHDFALGDPAHAQPLPAPVEPRYDAEREPVRPRATRRRGGATTQVILSQRGEVEGEGRPTTSSSRRASAGSSGSTSSPRSTATRSRRARAERRFGEELTRVRESLAAWQLRVPQLRSDWDDLDARLRPVGLRPRVAADARRAAGIGLLPAAGMPWFMTVFGRDTLITCLQTLLFGPELARDGARGARRAAGARGRPAIDAEPGKIVHEVRHGKAAEKLVPALLRHASTRRRSTSSCSPRSGAGPTTRALVRELKEPALRALEWIDEYGDRDGDGFVEYERRSARGLENQSWKDSRRLAALRRRPLAQHADRAVRGAGLRLRREAPRRPSSRARSGATARSPSGSSGRRPSCKRASTSAFWVERARRLLRARARRRQAAGRLALLEHRPPALERDRPRRARRRGRRPADGRRALVGLGRADDVGRRRRLQPARVPQRHRLAARQLPDRAGPRPLRALARGAADRPPDARRRAALRLPAARGVRRAARAPRRRSRSPIRRPRGRRPGRPARRCSCCSSCSASSPTGAATGSRRARPRSCRRGRARCASRACARSTASGTCGSTTAACTGRSEVS